MCSLTYFALVANDTDWYRSQKQGPGLQQLERKSTGHWKKTNVSFHMFTVQTVSSVEYRNCVIFQIITQGNSLNCSASLEHFMLMYMYTWNAAWFMSFQWQFIDAKFSWSCQERAFRYRLRIFNNFACCRTKVSRLLQIWLIIATTCFFVYQICTKCRVWSCRLWRQNAVSLLL